MILLLSINSFILWLFERFFLLPRIIGLAEIGSFDLWFRDSPFVILGKEIVGVEQTKPEDGVSRTSVGEFIAGKLSSVITPFFGS